MLSALILNEFPESVVTMFDLAKNMLDKCAVNLSAFKGRFNLKQGDFGKDYIGTGYDIVVSGFAIHHLRVGEKITLHSLL